MRSGWEIPISVVVNAKCRSCWGPAKQSHRPNQKQSLLSTQELEKPRGLSHWRMFCTSLNERCQSHACIYLSWIHSHKHIDVWIYFVLYVQQRDLGPWSREPSESRKVFDERLCTRLFNSEQFKLIWFQPFFESNWGAKHVITEKKFFSVSALRYHRCHAAKGPPFGLLAMKHP